MTTLSKPPEREEKYVVAALDRSMQLLEQLALTPDIGISEIAKRAGATKTQAFRLLYTLELGGYVRKDPASRTYALGYRILYLAEHISRQTVLIRTAQPYMRELASATGENVHLIVREGLHSVCIALEESEQPVRLYAAVGRLGPLHAGGGSTVLLAYAPADVQNEILAGRLEAFTPYTLTDPEQVRELLAQIQRQGYHLAKEDVDLGAYSVATCIRDHSGDVVAALSVAGPCSRLNARSQQTHTQEVVAAARAISEQLGWINGQS